MGNETEAVVLRCCVDLYVRVGIHHDCRYHQRWCVFYQRSAWWDKDLPEETKMFEVSHDNGERYAGNKTRESNDHRARLFTISDSKLQANLPRVPDNDAGSGGQNHIRVEQCKRRAACTSKERQCYYNSSRK